MKESSVLLVAKRDVCDHKNDKQAIKLILGTLDSKMEREADSRVENNDTTAEALFHWIDEELPRTMSTHLAEIDEIKVLTMAAFANVNKK